MAAGRRHIVSPWTFNNPIAACAFNSYTSCCAAERAAVQAELEALRQDTEAVRGQLENAAQDKDRIAASLEASQQVTGVLACMHPLHY